MRSIDSAAPRRRADLPRGSGDGACLRGRPADHRRRRHRPVRRAPARRASPRSASAAAPTAIRSGLPPPVDPAGAVPVRAASSTDRPNCSNRRRLTSPASARPNWAMRPDRYRSASATSALPSALARLDPQRDHGAGGAAARVGALGEHAQAATVRVALDDLGEPLEPQLDRSERDASPGRGGATRPATRRARRRAGTRRAGRCRRAPATRRRRRRTGRCARRRSRRARRSASAPGPAPAARPGPRRPVRPPRAGSRSVRRACAARSCAARARPRGYCPATSATAARTPR